MKNEIKHPDSQAANINYSAGVVIDGWLYISGQGPINVAEAKIVRGSIEEETRLTLANIGKILEAAGCSYDDVVKCTCHISDLKDFDSFNAVYRTFFKGVLPARTTVQSVLWSGIKVEIDAIARVKSR